MGGIEDLKDLTWRGVEWDPEDRPVILVDGIVHPFRSLSKTISGSAAYVIGVNDKTFPRLCERLRVSTLHFYEMRVSDIRPLQQLRGLRRLAIRWNTKLVDIGILAGFTSLEILVFEDTPKIHDLSPLSQLTALKELEFSGGIWNRNVCASLQPIADLPNLRRLFIWNWKVESGGLRPLARCTSLRELKVSSQFATEDYAYLSVRLPNAVCEMFAPFIRLGYEAEEKDVLVVGKRKPLLNSKKDKERLKKYAEEFRRLQIEFSKDRGV